MVQVLDKVPGHGESLKKSISQQILQHITCKLPIFSGALWSRFLAIRAHITHGMGPLKPRTCTCEIVMMEFIIMVLDKS